MLRSSRHNIQSDTIINSCHSFGRDIPLLGDTISRTDMAEFQQLKF